MHSCIYRGHVSHFRPAPAHRFRYATSWMYLDLGEVDDLVKSSWCLSQNRFAPASFRRADHFGDPDAPMLQSVHSYLESETGLRLTGPVRLLTQLRHFGVYFSPVNIFFCFDHHQSLAAMVAEVSNTPWNERHCYVLWRGNRLPGTDHQYQHSKAFHVSPFMGMDSTYDWRVEVPSERLQVSLGCLRKGNRIFQADLQLRRVELTGGQLIRSLARRPIAAAHIVCAIYYQALRLWMKKCQFYPHPQRTQDRPPAGRRRESVLVDSPSLDRR